MAKTALCSICYETLHSENDEVVTVEAKGMKTLIESSKKKEDDKWVNWEKTDEHKFRVKCRKRYAVSEYKFMSKKKKTSSFSNQSSSTVSCNVASTSMIFPFKQKCFICNEHWNRSRRSGRIVNNNNTTKYELLGVCEARTDDWGNSVRNRIESVPSLVTVEARYHVSCYSRFNRSTSGQSVGRPIVDNLASDFEKVCEYMENAADSPFQLSDLHMVMEKGIPANRTLFDMLKKKYGDDIFIFQQVGKQPILCFRNAVMSRLTDAWYANRENNTNNAEKDDRSERLRVIKDAAAVIRADIESTKYDVSSYASPLTFLDNIETDIPDSLTYFLENLLSPDEKEAAANINIKRGSIAHAIVSAVRPKTFRSTLQLAVSTYIYRKTASKIIINLLNKLGLCSSYYNAQLYEASIIMQSSLTFEPDVFVQFVFDNADHNTATLDGSNTFHCMGGICCVTPRDCIVPQGRIPKLEEMPSAAKLTSKNPVKIVPYGTFNTSGLEKIIYEDVSTLLIDESCQGRIRTTRAPRH